MIGEWLDRYLPPAVAAIEAIVEAHPLDGVTAAALAVARTEARARIEALGVKTTDNVVAALEADADAGRVKGNA